jgi:hypothetical protein
LEAAVLLVVAVRGVVDRQRVLQHLSWEESTLLHSLSYEPSIQLSI